MMLDITTIIYNVSQGLQVTVIGVLVIFGVLGLLATILYGLKYLQPGPKPEPLKKPVKEKAEAIEKLYPSPKYRFSERSHGKT